jgi:hypothetical protein
LRIENWWDVLYGVLLVVDLVVSWKAGGIFMRWVFRWWDRRDQKT